MVRYLEDCQINDHTVKTDNDLDSAFNSWVGRSFEMKEINELVLQYMLGELKFIRSNKFYSLVKLVPINKAIYQKPIMAPFPHLPPHQIPLPTMVNFSNIHPPTRCRSSVRPWFDSNKDEISEDIKTMVKFLEAF